MPTERRWQRCLLAAVGTLGCLALLAAACSGGSAGPDVASIGSTTTDTASLAASGVGGVNLQAVYQTELEYSRCMRAHGEPTFPDPVLSAHGINMADPVDANSPQFISANATCKKLVPNGGPPTAAQLQQMLARALKFAACMRSHGEPTFPDPVSDGQGIAIKLDGLNPRSPQFQAAMRTCDKLDPLGPPA